MQLSEFWRFADKGERVPRLWSYSYVQLVSDVLVESSLPHISESHLLLVYTHCLYCQH